jgi:hypothetical protein
MLLWWLFLQLYQYANAQAVCAENVLWGLGVCADELGLVGVCTGLIEMAFLRVNVLKEAGVVA